MDFAKWEEYKINIESLTVNDLIMRNRMFAGNVWMRDCKILGNLDNTNARFAASLFQSGMQVKGSIFRDPLEPSDIEFLKSIPLDVLNMKHWHSNKNWLKCKTREEINTCGTTYCIRGYAEAEYFIKHRVQAPDSDALYPRLKYLFHLTDEEAKNEIQRILENYK